MSNSNTVTFVYHDLHKLSIMRLCCRHQDCRAVLELRPEQIEAAMKKTGACCSLCGRPFTKPGGTDAVTLLAKALLALDELGDQVKVQLPLDARKVGQP